MSSLIVWFIVFIFAQLGIIFIGFWDNDFLMQLIHFWILEALQLSALVFCESCQDLTHILYLKSLGLER